MPLAFSMQSKYFGCTLEGNINLMVHSSMCPGGGIGRRARFRSVYRKMWRFEFSPGHHQQQTFQTGLKAVQENVSKNNIESHCKPVAFLLIHAMFGQNGTAIRSWPCVPTIRAFVNSPTFIVLLIFSGGKSFTMPSISGASA